MSAMKLSPPWRKLLLMVAPAVGVTLLVLMVALAIYKPGWRLRFRSNGKRG